MDAPSEPAWQRSQIGLAVMIPVIVGEGVALAVLAVSGLHLIIIPVVLVTGIVLAMFHRLVVTVTLDHVEAAFGIGLIRRRVPVDQIVGARRVRTGLLDGWGIRMQRGGWLWNISGFDAVELTLENGRIWVIGTDRPEEALAAIEAVAGLGGGPAGGPGPEASENGGPGRGDRDDA